MIIRYTEGYNQPDDQKSTSNIQWKQNSLISGAERKYWLNQNKLHNLLLSLI